jgi:hypothetical protein
MITLKPYLRPDKTYKSFVLRATLENPPKKLRTGNLIQKLIEAALLDFAVVATYFATAAYKILHHLVHGFSRPICWWLWGFLLFCAVNWLAI